MVEVAARRDRRLEEDMGIEIQYAETNRGKTENPEHPPRIINLEPGKPEQRIN